MTTLNTHSQIEKFQQQIEALQNQQLILARKTAHYNEFLAKHYDALVVASRKVGVGIVQPSFSRIQQIGGKYTEASYLYLEFDGEFCGHNKPLSFILDNSDRLYEKAKKLKEKFEKAWTAVSNYEVEFSINPSSLEIEREDGSLKRITLTIIVK